MFSFLTRRRRPCAPVRRRTQLRLERLERRDCPSGGPVFSAFGATVLPGHLVRLQGTVMDNNPASVGISFSGVMSGTASADASGNFTYQGSATGLGVVSAVAVDGQGLTSNTVSAQVSTPAPGITLTITNGSQRTVTLSGKVTDVDTGGLTVTFTGKVNATTTTAADGSFSLTTQASALGQVQAAVTDLWGQAGTAQASVTSAAPSISNFTAVQEIGGYWTFSGKVTDESPEGLTVTFGGLLAGKTATVQADGTFSLTIQLTPGTSGTVTAQTTDWWGLQSNTASDYVDNPGSVTGTP